MPIHASVHEFEHPNRCGIQSFDGSDINLTDCHIAACRQAVSVFDQARVSLLRRFAVPTHHALAHASSVQGCCQPVVPVVVWLLRRMSVLLAHTGVRT